MNSSTIAANRRARKESISTLKCMIILGPGRRQVFDVRSDGSIASHLITRDDIERAKRTIEHLEGLI